MSRAEPIVILSKRVDVLETHMKEHECQIEIVAEGVQKLHERMDRVEKKLDQTATKREVNALAEKIQLALDALAL